MDKGQQIIGGDNDYVLPRLAYLENMETRIGIQANYIGRYDRVMFGWRERTILIDWLFEVSADLFPLTRIYALAVQLFDRLMCTNGIQTQKVNLQLVGIVCLMIASKYESAGWGMNPKTCFEYSAGYYPLTDIIATEKRVLSLLKYDLGFPVGRDFFGTRNGVICFFTDLAMLDNGLVGFLPSMLAQAIRQLIAILDKRKLDYSTLSSLRSGNSDNPSVNQGMRLLVLAMSKEENRASQLWHFYREIANPCWNFVVKLERMYKNTRALSPGNTC